MPGSITSSGSDPTLDLAGDIGQGGYDPGVAFGTGVDPTLLRMWEDHIAGAVTVARSSSPDKSRLFAPFSTSVAAEPVACLGPGAQIRGPWGRPGPAGDTA